MSENGEAAELVAFTEQSTDRVKELMSIEQEIALLTEQITTKDEHLRQLSAQRNNLHGKYQSIRNAHQDMVMKFMMDWIGRLDRDDH